MTHKDMFKDMTYDSLEKQVGGKHYRSMKIQPAHFINENKLAFCRRQRYKVYMQTLEQGESRRY
jgi:hypothetical protein